MRTAPLLFALASLFVLGCPSNESDPDNLSEPDAGMMSNDTGPSEDAGIQPDATVEEDGGETVDSGPVDSGTDDAGAPDTGAVDSGELPDSGAADSGPADVMLSEANNFASGVNPCGLAYDHVSDRIWVVACSSRTIQGFMTDGTPAETVSIAGETPNDVDLDIAPEAMTLAGGAQPEGALLMINGESAEAEIYGLDKLGGATTATLATAFGNSHVVGGAYHAARDTFFLVQDRQAPTADRNRVSEIDPDDGMVLGSFQVTPEFSVNYGDLDVCQSTGDLFLVSSDETTIGHFTVNGTYVAEYPLPAGVSGAAGIAFDNQTGEAWIAGTGGTIWRITGLPCGPF